MFKFEKTAGMILDQQDDPGAGWEIIEPFWPDDLPPPDVGVEISKQACAIDLTDGVEKVARYPVDSPSNALASSMYFLAFGLDPIDDEGHAKIAELLQDYRIAHEVNLPQEFVDALKKEAEWVPEDIFADSDGYLPITSPEQIEESVKVFSKYAERWDAAERMQLAVNLAGAAYEHGLDIEVPYSEATLSKTASGAINQRISLMEQLCKTAGEEEGFEDYFEAMELIKEALSLEDLLEFSDLKKMAQDIEAFDQEFGLDEAWGTEILDPVESLLYGFNDDPFPDLQKEAADFSSVDWSDLPFDDEYKDAISENPDVIIPTLPAAEKRIVEDYVNGKV